eukprot:EG_transcript_772
MDDICLKFFFGQCQAAPCPEAHHFSHLTHLGQWAAFAGEDLKALQVWYRFGAYKHPDFKCYIIPGLGPIIRFGTEEHCQKAVLAHLDTPLCPQPFKEFDMNQLQEVVLRAAKNLKEEDVQVITTQGMPTEDGDAPEPESPAPPLAVPTPAAPLPNSVPVADGVFGPAPGLLPTPAPVPPPAEPHWDSDRWDLPLERPMDDPSFFHEGPDFALHAACGENEIRHVRELVLNGYDVNMPAKSKQSPLHHAAWRGYCDIVQLLIDQKANVHAMDQRGWTPLHMAVAGCDELAEDYIEVVESLIAAGAKVNDVGGAHGQTALHLAAREGLVQVADKLVQRGAQNRPDVNGRTPMDYALRRRRDDGGVASLEMVELLKLYFGGQGRWNGEPMELQAQSQPSNHLSAVAKWRCYDALRKAAEIMDVWRKSPDPPGVACGRVLPQIHSLLEILGHVVPTEIMMQQRNSADPYHSVSVCNGAWLDDDYKPFSEKRFPFRPPHMSVLVDEILEGLGAHQGGYFIDGTFGAGGHSLAILKAHPLNYVLAMDVDPGVQGFVEHVYHRYPDRFTFVPTVFSQLASIALEKSIPQVSGVLLDLGQSFMQIDTPSRGHSHKLPGPLDMRFNTTCLPTAADFLNNASFEELCYCLESTQSSFTPVRIRRIANIIMDGRTHEPLQTVGQLRGLLASHFLTDQDIKLTFQSIRMHINREIYEISTGAKAAWSMLGIGGRLCIIVFKPPEREAVERVLNEPPIKGTAHVHRQCPTHDEYLRNSRCHSAELFVITKLM